MLLLVLHCILPFKFCSFLTHYRYTLKLSNGCGWKCLWIHPDYRKECSLWVAQSHPFREARETALECNKRKEDTMLFWNSWWSPFWVNEWVLKVLLDNHLESFSLSCLSKNGVEREKSALATKSIKRYVFFTKKDRRPCLALIIANHR